MVYAKVLRPPSHGAKLKNLDTSAVDAMEGFQVIRDGELVAILHENPYEAERAVAKLKADYDLPEARFDDKTVFGAGPMSSSTRPSDPPPLSR